MTRRISRWAVAVLPLLAALSLCSTATAASGTITTSPSAVTAGQPVTVTWSGVSPVTMWDWIGVFHANTPASDPSIASEYANTCTKTRGTTAHSSGTCSLVIPGDLAPGSYEVRYYTTSRTLLARSQPFTTTVATCFGTTPNIHEYQDGCPLYQPNSWVNAPLPASAPVDPNTPSYMAAQLRTMDLNPDGTLMSGAPTGLRWDEGVDVYVTNSTDRSTWKTVCSSEVLNGTSWAWMNQLHNAWVTFKAPIPDTGFPATDGGSDKGATLYDAATGEMWDYYQWHGPAAAGTTDPQGHTCDYTAGGGDYQRDIANNPGYFVNQDLGSGVTESNMWGRRASALPSTIGVITPDEWNNPLPDFGHTLQIIVGCANLSKQYWPAKRHDGCTGTGGTGGIPEGARFRIDPSYVCPHRTAGATGPTQLAYDRAYAFCVTLQKYGGVVTDQTGGGTGFTLAAPYGGKPAQLAPDGGNCCSSTTVPGSGRQWPNWYWDVGVDKGLATAQVIDPSYRPPFAPAQ